MKTILLILALIGVNLTGFAQWSTDPTQSNLIRQGTNTIREFTLHTDNNDGTFLVWEDWRTFGPNIYAQRITTVGLPQWGENEGHIVRAMQGNEELVASIAEIGSISDGNGNAIIAWSDDREAHSQVYVQKINGTGQTQWQNRGLNICTNCVVARRLKIAGDGNGGAIIAWTGTSEGDKPSEVYIQRINSSGVGQWQNNGVKVTQSEDYGNDLLDIVSDGNGGAIITWKQNSDSPYGPNPMLAQRIDQNGNALWDADGVPMGIIIADVHQPSSITDGNAGIITVWYDVRNSSGNLYAQRINADGQPQWTLGGIPVCTATEEQTNPRIISDAQGGAIIAWEDARNGPSNHDIYAQRINASGQAQWTAYGIPVCAQSSNQGGPLMTPDEDGGAVLTWSDTRNADVFYGDRDVYAQRLNGAGALLWENNGAPVAIGERSQGPVAITTDDNGGFVIVSRTDASIFASRLNKDGSLPVTLVSFEGRKENDNAVLTWKTSQETNNKGFEIERSEDGKQFEKIGFVDPYSYGSDTIRNYQYLDTNPSAGSNYYRLKQLDHDGKFAYSKIVNVNFGKASRISVYPNPTVGDLFIETMHAGGRIQITDMLGRIVFERRMVNPRTYIDVKDLSPGMYILREGASSQAFVKQ
ncbi:T9SS type A sorting domain-containing protein [Dyadobacter aurulentus]|uniref:T9SS type A sorting domain-containing protein n=1 Tax=Dyadobacter sp. UC 10 TaxID=2605428 RepID=UPI0011F2206C|nr:T9SS type A sorting domain-containing protein [Dyadobacter sp. UC 10]KAA0990389.1 T9SS type A sorting domain-containing protein [Dyadobacter sp. UC 10]